MDLRAISRPARLPLWLATKKSDQLLPPKVGPVGWVARQHAPPRVQLGKPLGRDSTGDKCPETVGSPDEAPLHSLPAFGLTAILGHDPAGVWCRNLFGEKRASSPLRSPPRGSHALGLLARRTIPKGIDSRS